MQRFQTHPTSVFLHRGQILPEDIFFSLHASTPTDNYVQHTLLVLFPEDSINYAGKIINRMDKKELHFMHGPGWSTVIYFRYDEQRHKRQKMNQGNIKSYFWGIIITL